MDNKPLVAIYFRTRNRSDFVIRQLEYYASVNSPHPVYIADGSDEEHGNKIQTAIKKLEGALKVIYKLYRESESFTQIDSHNDLVSLIKEKYGASIGDDDYFIPDSLTKCAEFLEEHPDYASAGGYAVSFRLKNNGVHGELNYLADYPRKQIELETASERVVKFFREYYTPGFSVHRMDPMRRYWLAGKDIPDRSLATEVVPSALLLVGGKSKIIDCLSLVRQIHNRHLATYNAFDWIMKEHWYKSYKMAEDILAKEIMAVDGIGEKEAKTAFRKALWGFLNWLLIKDFGDEFPSAQKPESQYSIRYRRLRSMIGSTFPIIKKIYRTKVKPLKTGKKYLHYEVLEPSSKYYKDFKPIMNSFT